MRIGKNYLTRYVEKDKALTYYAFDIEYTRKDGILLEACIGDETTQHFYRTWDETLDGLFTHACNRKAGNENGTKTRFIVHSGDIAEFNHLIQYIMSSCKEEYEILTTTSGDTIVGLEVRKGRKRVIMHDMFAIFPQGLERIASIFAPQYPKLKGAVDFSQRDYNPDTDQEYLRRDVQATIAAYRSICTLIKQHFGVMPSMTAAGTAMRAWLASLAQDIRYYRLNSTTEDFCRNGYFGAYVYPGRDNQLHTDVVSYDITAAYGARMRYLFPVGKPLYTIHYTPDHLGMWYIRVTCIDAPLPIVPYRKSENSGVYWLGRKGDSCETYAITQEVEYYKTHGYKVEVLYGYYWLESAYVFRDFIDKVERVESIDKVTKECAKLMRNALYGRFGTKKYHEKLIVTHQEELGMIPYADPRTGNIVPYLYTVEEELNVPYIQPHWAAHITAYQRLAMYDLIYQCGVENCLGCDTDSIKTYTHMVELKHLPLSATEYGKGKIEAHWDVYRSHGPKNYCGKEGDKYYIKSKGIPKKAITEDMIHKHLYRNEETEIIVNFISITKGLTMMKSDGKKPFNTPQHRTLSSLHSEKWELINNLFVPVQNMV